MLCRKCLSLLEDVSVASTRYFEATSRLMRLAGSSSHISFEYAKRECAGLRDDCSVAKLHLRDHQASHDSP